MRTAAEKLLDRLAHERDARRAADQHDFLDFCGCEFRVGERLAHGAMVRSTIGRIKRSYSAREISRK
jgi:hypothetical protein